MFHTICIIGLGLIGSSIARDVRERKLAEAIIGVDPHAEHVQLLRREGVIDQGSSAVDARVKEAELFIIAGPPLAFEKIAHAIAHYGTPESIVTDVGSVKQYAIRAIAHYLPDPARYVPAHPIAGSAESGAAAGHTHLFEGKRIILTPEEYVAEDAKDKVAAFWQALGGIVGEMDAATHDLIYAHVSHLPQAVAYAAIMTLRPYLSPHQGGTPFLRLAGSNPALWRDIFLCNKDDLLPVMHIFSGIIAHFIAEFESGSQAGHPSKISEETATRFFPRIIASSLISTVQNGELKYGKRMAPFIGAGFADITSPALEAPEEDIEKIAGSYQQVAVLLREFSANFSELTKALETDETALFKLLSHAQHAYQTLSD